MTALVILSITAATLWISYDAWQIHKAGILPEGAFRYTMHYSANPRRRYFKHFARTNGLSKKAAVKLHRAAAMQRRELAKVRRMRADMYHQAQADLRAAREGRLEQTPETENMIRVLAEEAVA